ncbi:MAG TPA: hypothetical protein V6D05_14435 [Stenomitos sp.]
MRTLRQSMTIALALVAITGCQAPGFMGLSGNSTVPEATQGAHMVRARFRVLIPASLSQGLNLAPYSAEEATRSGGHLDDRSVVGAKVFLEGQNTLQDTTDDLGFADLAVPQGRLTPVRAEFKAPGGTVSMTALILVDEDAASAPVFSITLASTLVTSKIAQRFRYEDLNYLPYDKIESATLTVDQAIRDRDGSYDPSYLPNLGRQWTVLDTAKSIARLDPILTRALADVLATQIPATASATVSATASAAPAATVSVLPKLSEATVSVPASPSVEATTSARVADLSLFTAAMGQRWTYDLLDDQGEPSGTMVREVVKVAAKPNGVLLTGSEQGDWNPSGNGMRFLMKRTPTGVSFAAAYRPQVNYPLPMADGQTWRAATDVTAVAHAEQDAWRVDFTRVQFGKTTSWSEWLAPGVGFTRLQWVDPRTNRRWEARLHTDPDPTPSP